ncbi:MAG: hypothetical protein ACC628_11295, partial [Pirellulaceae bacterium]
SWNSAARLGLCMFEHFLYVSKGGSANSALRGTAQDQLPRSSDPLTRSFRKEGKGLGEAVFERGPRGSETRILYLCTG